MPADSTHPRAAPEPRLSVIVPTHQRAQLLPRAIATLQAQTFTDFEILVVDDASRDGTPQVLAELAAREPRLRPLRLEQNRGPGGARNHALAQARGELVAFLDDDDRSFPDRFARQVAAFDQYPSVGLVASTVVWVDAEGQTLRVAPGKMTRGELPTQPLDLARWLYLEGNWLPTSSLMARRASLEGCYFLEGVAAGEDWFFLLQWTTRAAARQGPDAETQHYFAEPLIESLRDPAHISLMSDKIRAHAAQRKVLAAFAAWLQAQGLTALDDLHALARAHQWIREAYFLGGLRGLPLIARATMLAPSAPRTREAWRWLGHRLRDRLWPGP